MPWVSLVILLVVLSPGVALAPKRWAIRLWTIIALLFAATVLLQGEVQVQDQGMLPDRLIVGGLTFILSLPLIAITLRKAHADVVTQSSFRSTTPSKHEGAALRWLDLCIAAIAGLCAGLLLTLALAVALRGFPGGLTLHLAVATLAAAGTIASLRYLKGTVRAAIAPALLLIAGLTLLGGFFYPQLIVSKMAEIESNLPRCLRAVDRPANSDETRLLTLPLGQPGGPGLILTVMDPRGAQHFRWSYRLLTFTPFEGYRYGGCPV